MIPYHGEPFRDVEEVNRAQAKDGISAYVVRHGQRYTVARTGVTENESHKDVIRRPLRQATSVGIRPRLLLLDRGSYSVAVIRCLRQARVPFLMPVVCHGRSPK